LEDKDVDNRPLPLIDWNNGSNPLDAWLNQSAIPAAAPWSGQQQQEDSARKKQELLMAEEAKELEAFHNIHSAKTPERPDQNAHLVQPEDGSDLSLSAQIFLRNILDRYPSLPSFLARRLANANQIRAERLQWQRPQTEAEARDKVEAIMKGCQGLQRQLDSDCLATPASPRLANYRRPRGSNASMNTWADGNASRKQSSPSNFWTPENSSNRPSSVDSRSSSKNSSLHGSQVHDPEEQSFSPTSPAQFHSRSGSGGFDSMSRGLPPPSLAPNQCLDKGTRKSAEELLIDCDICGNNIRIGRRLDWQ